MRGTLPISLVPRDTTVLTLRFAPGSPCSPCSGQLALQSNDPDQSLLAVPLTGVGLPPPDIAVSPASLDASLLAGESGTRTLRIDNLGNSPLAWNISPRTALQSVASRSVTPSTWQVLGPASLLSGVNREGAAPAAQAIRATYSGSIAGPRILLYSDEYTASPGFHMPDLALQSLGRAYTAYYNDPAGFGNALVSQSWDLVIVSHANFFELGRWWNEIDAFLENGGRVLITTFDIDGSHSEPTTLWSTIGLAPSSSDPSVV